ncbi:EthD domain-containing protein [Xylariaceae sp. FL0804]|nr:EthD domain-containing protein [Xylariaceae sp. FL0804]
MTYSILIKSYRKPGLTPAQFKAHMERVHVPLVRELAGAAFPLAHTRRYPDHAAANRGLLAGSPTEFAYDAVAELTFEDEAASQAYFARVGRGEAAERLAKDRAMFVDPARVSIVVLADVTVTRRDDAA